MSADDPKGENETPETLQDEQEAGGPPQDELDAEAPTTDAGADESGDEPKAEAEDAAAEPQAEADEDKPKPKRKPAAKKKAEPKAEEGDEAGGDAADAEEKPKPKRTRAKKDEPKAEEAKTEEAEKPAKPAATRKRDQAPSTNGQPQVVRAQARYVRTSARKARLVCDHLRGKSVEEARAILLHTPRHVARDWSKLLESAVANAEHNHELVGDELRILSITADEGPTIKRFRPRAMGRASRIRKRTAHLSISLTSKEAS